MGLLSDTKNNYKLDAEGYNDSECSGSAREYNQYFGIKDMRHIQLRKSIGFAWPLVSGAVTTTIPSNITNTSIFYHSLRSGYANLSTSGLQLMPKLDKNNYSNLMLYTKNISVADPEIWNIPYVKTGDIDDADVKFLISSNIDQIPVSDVWQPVKFLSAVKDHFDMVTADDKYYNFNYENISFLNLESVWKKYIEKFNIDVNGNNDPTIPKLIMEVTNTIKYEDPSNLIFGSVSKSSSKWTVKWKNNTINNTDNISAYLDNNISGGVIIGIQNISTLSGKTDGTDYLNLRNDAGSVSYEYPKCKNIIRKNVESDSKFKYTARYEFKNALDFVLFYYHYKHVINHFFSKMNLLFKSVKFIGNHSTSGSFFEEYENILNSPLEYVNAATYANLANVSKILQNCECYFRAFPYDTQTADLTSGNIVSPYGNITWVDNNKQSKFPDYSVENIYDVDNKDYTQNMKKLLSLYRPFYFEHKNSFVTPKSSTTLNSDSLFTGDYLNNTKKGLTGL
jgi:hypothetical protein